MVYQFGKVGKVIDSRVPHQIVGDLNQEISFKEETCGRENGLVEKEERGII